MPAEHSLRTLSSEPLSGYHEKIRLTDTSFPFQMFIQKDVHVLPHWHEETELIQVLDGQMRIHLGTGQILMKAGDILFIGDGGIHGMDRDCGHNTSLYVQFALNAVEKLSLPMDDRRLSILLMGRSIVITRQKDPVFFTLMNKQLNGLKKEYQGLKEGHRIAFKARLLDMLLILLRNLPPIVPSATVEKKRLLTMKRLGGVFSHIGRNYDKPIHLKDAAGVAFMSVYHFAHFFKQSTGRTFSRYLSEFRIKKAEWYLLNSTDTVSQISYRCGINSIKTFNRLFKKSVGCTPSEFRRKS